MINSASNKKYLQQSGVVGKSRTQKQSTCTYYAGNCFKSFLQATKQALNSSFCRGAEWAETPWIAKLELADLNNGNVFLVYGFLGSGSDNS